MLIIEEINRKINYFRYKLNEAYKTKGHTREVVDMSKELDKYIIIVKQELIKRIGDKND
ncbi:Spo0E family sporulation regulatory protein-aspartic acid phosphatase [Maledivibacter halophilus]|uniref:Spo0E family sporulation regulatory protein-aspartic acid phosphatase n=1 Tax=Maledivibacter halophilus TaxID=36842 RepID=UPI0014820B02|nr:Spo0E family sporulation regulatory protein-aspartic acid phosphatase [Maledivibacter halophilus]